MTKLKMFSDGHDWIIAKNMQQVKKIYKKTLKQKIENIDEWTELDCINNIRVSMDIYDFISQFNSNQLPRQYKLNLVGGRIVVETAIIAWLIITEEPTYFMSMDY